MIKRIIFLILVISSAAMADYQMKIQDFVNVVATQNNINIATDKTIDKDFNFYINKTISQNVTVQVLEKLLDDNGYALVRESPDYYMIKKKDDLLINKIKIYPILYADPQKVKDKCDKILKGYYKNIKTTIITSQNKELTPLQEVNKNASNQQIQQTEEKVNYDVEVLDEKSIAVTYKDDFVPGVVGPVVYQIDRKPARIKVIAKIYEVNTDALKQFSSKLTTQAGTGYSGLVSSAVSSTGSLSIGDNVNIASVITALQSNGSANLMSQPSLTMYEGSLAKLTSGKSYPIQKDTTTTTNNSTTTTTSYVNQNTGITMGLDFRTFKGGFIYLNMDLEQTAVDTYDTTTHQILTTQKSLVNKMMIQPGSVTYLGGMITDKKKHSKGGIPLLKDIPLLGYLFRFGENSTEKEILVIELQAVMINDHEYKPFDHDSNTK